jgi:hypothetical protein
MTGKGVELGEHTLGTLKHGMTPIHMNAFKVLDTIRS